MHGHTNVKNNVSLTYFDGTLRALHNKRKNTDLLSIFTYFINWLPLVLKIIYAHWQKPSVTSYIQRYKRNSTNKFDLIIWNLFYIALNTSHIVSNGQMICGLWIGKDSKGSGLNQIELHSQHVPGHTLRKWIQVIQGLPHDITTNDTFGSYISTTAVT
jgi:hypothetical protein